LVYNCTESDCLLMVPCAVDLSVCMGGALICQNQGYCVNDSACVCYPGFIEEDCSQGQYVPRNNVDDFCSPRVICATVSQPISSVYHARQHVVLSASVCLSRPGTDPSPGEIETPGFYARQLCCRVLGKFIYYIYYIWRFCPSVRLGCHDPVPNQAQVR